MKSEHEVAVSFQQVCKIIGDGGCLRKGLKAENERDHFQIAVMRLVMGWTLGIEPYHSEMEKDLEKVRRAVQIVEEKERVARAWKNERPDEN